MSLLLGLFVRLWGTIGALQIGNLWLGLTVPNASGPGPISFCSC